jgi:hypothetical protein
LKFKRQNSKPQLKNSNSREFNLKYIFWFSIEVFSPVFYEKSANLTKVS